MVCTRCFTYNHAAFIVDAMNGFTIQETSFPIVHVIVDDASTDGEPEVIRKYVSDHFHVPYRTEETDDYALICAKHKINPNCLFAVYFLKYNHHSIKKFKNPYFAEWFDNAKYHALCEGDDYWIHPRKIQMQVEFMEGHCDYTVCCHRYFIYNEVTKEQELDKLDDFFQNNNKYYTFDKEEHVKKMLVRTYTLLYRSSAYDQNLFFKFKYYRDVHNFYSLLLAGKGCLLPFIGSVYRRNPGSMYAFTSDYDKGRMGYLTHKELDRYYHDKVLFKLACHFYKMLYSEKIKGNGRLIIDDWYDFRVLIRVLMMKMFHKVIKH